MSIYEVRDCRGKIRTGTLPSGDVTVSGRGDRSAVDLACSIARRHLGVWNSQHENWVIPRRNSIALTNDLAELCRSVA